LAIFVSSIFDLDIFAVIVVLGFVVLIYSTTGGSWAVMSTDFLQGTIMVSMTLLLSVLCLVEFGGPGAFLEAIGAAGLWSEYLPVKEAGDFPRNQYTLPWGLGIFGYIITADANFSGAPRYFVVKDGREAKRTALLSLGLQVVFLPLILIPPITARLRYPEQVAAADLGKPAEAAYAITSLELLPPAMIGLMVIAMFASSMSSMDTGINRNAAIFVRDILPALRRLFRKPGTPGKHEMLLNRSISVFFGLCVIATALYLAASSRRGMFEVVNAFGALVGLPLAIPLFFGMLMKKLPRWTPFVSIPAALIPSAMALYASRIAGEPWDYSTQVVSVFLAGFAGVLASRLCWHRTSRRSRRFVLRFFRKMNTPVNFDDEVGKPVDDFQLKRLGWVCSLVAGFILTTVVFADDRRDLICIVAVALFVGVVGGLLLALARRFAGQRS
jgi:Na+/proline symporter